MKELTVPDHARSLGERVWRQLMAGDAPLVLWVIVLFALALRLYQASHHPFTSDELVNIPVVESIRLSVAHPIFVLSGPDHPLLNVYAAHMSTLLLGKTFIGYRAANALMGALTCWGVYLLAKEIAGKQAGLWAALLLSIDQFHTTLSGALNSNDVGVLFFGTLALVCCSRLDAQATWRPFLGLGLCMGLAYLSKETALLLLPVPWIYMIVSPERRSILKDRRWYVAHLVFLLVISPDLWNLVTTGGWLRASSDKALVGNTSLIQGKAVSLFLGELVMLAKPDILGGTESYWCWPLRTVHWVAGLLYLFATAWAWRLRRQRTVPLVLLCFALTVGAVSVMPGQDFWDPFWWASMAISPAIVCAGVYLDAAIQRNRKWLWIIAPLMVWLLVRTVTQQNTRYCYPGASSMPPASASL